MQQETPAANEPREPARRESVWGILSDLWVIYFILFGALYAAGAGFLVWYATTQGAGAGAAALIAAVIPQLAQAGAGAAITAYALTEGGRLIVVAAWIIKEKFLANQKKREDAARAKTEAQIAEQRAEILAEAEAEIRAEAQERMAEQRAEIRAEAEAEIRAEAEAEIRAEAQERMAKANRKVQEWNGRRIRALLLDQPFNEEPPDLTQP